MSYSTVSDCSEPSSYYFDMDVGDSGDVKPILRQEQNLDEAAPPTPSGRRLSWVSDEYLEDIREFGKEKGDSAEKKSTKGKNNKKDKNVKSDKNDKNDKKGKKKESEEEDEASAKEEKALKKTPKVIRKVKAKKAKVHALPDPFAGIWSDEEETVPLAIDDDVSDEEEEEEEEEGALVIDEGEDEEDEATPTKSKKKKTKEEIKAYEEALERRREELEERLNSKKEYAPGERYKELDLIEALIFGEAGDTVPEPGSEVKLKKRIMEPKTPEQLRREVARRLAEDEKYMTKEFVRQMESRAFAAWEEECAAEDEDYSGEEDDSDGDEREAVDMDETMEDSDAPAADDTYDFFDTPMDDEDPNSESQLEARRLEEEKRKWNAAVKKSKKKARGGKGAAKKKADDDTLEADKRRLEEEEEAKKKEDEEKKGKKGGKNKKGGAATKKKENAALEDMPDMTELEAEVNTARITRQSRAAKRSLVESEGDETQGEEEVKKGKRGGGKKGKRGGGKKGGAKAEAAKKKKEEPQTEEEVIAEIGRKKAESLVKATKTKNKKQEDMARRREEREKEKEEKEKAKEDKKMKKEEELARKRRSNEQSPDDGLKPKSRAESARRTKKLLAWGPNEAGLTDDSDEEMEDEDETEEEEEEGEPEKKKRKYNKRKSSTPATPLYYYSPPQSEAGEDDEPCGKYVNNPCEYEMEDFCTTEPLTDFSSDEDDNVLTMPRPFLWTSDEDKLAEGAMGPVNFDADEAMKRHLNDVEKFDEGTSVEYYDMIDELDEMKLNLFGESMYRRFNPKLIHNVDSMATMSCWPADRMPKTGEPLTKYKALIWKFDAKRPFKGIVRIRPVHMEQDVETSHDIDVLTGCADKVPVVTKQDLVDNVRELVQSKLKPGTEYTPLPSDKNPWDVPEVSTRPAKVVREPKDVKVKVVRPAAALSAKEEPAGTSPGAYIKKVAVPKVLPVVIVKTRKRTRKELLKETPANKRGGGGGVVKREIKAEVKDIGETPRRPIVVKREVIFNDAKCDEEEEVGGETEGEDAYKYEWNETEELMANPMRDDHMGEDPFDCFDKTEYDDAGEEEEEEEEELDGGARMVSVFKQEPMEETGFGEAFRFMAAHLDV